jgi:hypothetical protein
MPPAGGASAKATAEAHVVSTAVGAVDHRVGFAGQLVVPPGVEAPDDR